MANDYEVLGVEPGATADQIRDAWRALCQIYHPDRFVSASVNVRTEAERRMSAVNDSYRRLLAQAPAASGRDTHVHFHHHETFNIFVDQTPSPERTPPMPSSTLFVSRREPVVWRHPLTYVQHVEWPPFDHPNVVWYTGESRSAVKRFKTIFRPAGWGVVSESGEMTITPKKIRLDRRMPARPRAVEFSDGSIGVSITIFGGDLSDLKAAFSLLRSSPGVKPRP